MDTEKKVESKIRSEKLEKNGQNPRIVAIGSEDTTVVVHTSMQSSREIFV